MIQRLLASWAKKIIFPEDLVISGEKISDLRYGENPHQKAAFYMQSNSDSPLKNLKRLWGRELSLVNITDINAGLQSVQFFDKPTAVVIKHNTPCGIAMGINIKQALKRAIEGDPESAFGGIIVLNQTMDIKTAKVISSFKNTKKGNIDIVAVPNINKDALLHLKETRKSMGIYTFGKFPEIRKDDLNTKWINGGFVLQTADNDIDSSFAQWEVVTKIKPTKKQLRQMQIGWKFISRIRSNAIIIMDKDLPMTRGIGTGQTSRVRATKIALEQAGKYVKGGVLASDSFFPFDDSVKLAVKYKIGAIVQQGESINDKAPIAAADKAKMPMVFTHRRAFWH